MAFPNEIQAARYNAILHKLLDMKEGAPAPSLAPDVFAMLALEVDRPEWEFLAGAKRCYGGYPIAAGGAGTYTSLALWNPPASNMLIVTDKIRCQAGSRQTFTLKVGSTAPSGGAGYSTTVYDGVTDTRWGVTATTAKPSGQLWQGASASPLGSNVLGQIDLLTGWEELVVVIGPGTGLFVNAVTVNTAETLYMTWHERLMAPSETR